MALVPEEKVSCSLCALSVSTLTVAKIRKVYNKLDSKAIAKQVRHVNMLVLCCIKATGAFKSGCQVRNQAVAFGCKTYQSFLGAKKKKK